MEANTLFILQLAGPIFTLAGVSLLLNKSYYEEMIDELEDQAWISYMSGAINVVLATLIYLTHGFVFSGLETGFVSVLLILMILKGVVLLLIPRSLETIVQLMQNDFAIIGSGLFTLVLGVYAMYIGYFV
jgi:hypothetical protein